MLYLRHHPLSAEDRLPARLQGGRRSRVPARLTAAPPQPAAQAACSASATKSCVSCPATRTGYVRSLRRKSAPDEPPLSAAIWVPLRDSGRRASSRADRRLSQALPVYAAPGQDVCSVDM